MAQTGRKTKLTKELQEEILKYVEAGNFVKVACEGVGIDQHTIINWRHRAENKEEPFLTFFTLLKKAEAKAHLVHVTNIMSKAMQDWKASAWYLERKHNDKWGKRETVNVQHKDNDNDGITDKLENLTLEDLQTLITGLTKEIEKEEKLKINEDNARQKKDNSPKVKTRKSKT